MLLIRRKKNYPNLLSVCLTILYYCVKRCGAAFSFDLLTVKCDFKSVMVLVVCVSVLRNPLSIESYYPGPIAIFPQILRDKSVGNNTRKCSVIVHFCSLRKDGEDRHIEDIGVLQFGILHTSLCCQKCLQLPSWVHISLYVPARIGF